MAPEMNSTSWSTSYSQYLARSAALSARTLNLYQLALERISQGKLPPTVFQDHFSAFAATHAAECSKRLSEVASRFLGDVVRMGAGFAHQEKSAASEPEIVPPRFDASNPGRWYEALAEYAAQLNTRALKAYRAQLDRVAAGEITPSEVQKGAAEQMSQQLPGYMELVTQAYFECLNGLNDVRSVYEETYFQGLLATAKDEDSDALITLTLAGSLGTTAVASLTVTNTTGRRTRILHQVFEARRLDGVGSSLIPNVVFAPEALELGPNEEGTLNLSLRLDPASYDASLYAGKLHLAGASEVPLEVELRILATAEAPNPPNRSNSL
jgi:hypothetical protein